MTTRHRIVTTAEVDAQQEGGVYLWPGVWRDTEGHVHFCVPELLDLASLPDTPANRDAVIRICQSVMEAAFGPTDTLIQELADER